MTGSSARANGGDGVSLLFNVDSATVGGATAASRNIISANAGDGVSVFGYMFPRKLDPAAAPISTAVGVMGTSIPPV